MGVYLLNACGFEFWSYLSDIQKSFFHLKSIKLSENKLRKHDRKGVNKRNII